jgi:hypothetical protein
VVARQRLALQVIDVATDPLTGQVYVVAYFGNSITILTRL